LIWAGALATAIGAAHHFDISLTGRKATAAPGYGTDPNLSQPEVPWPRLLTGSQRTALRHVADFILPREGEAPSAGEVGVVDLIDEWVSAPYPDQVKDQALIIDGLAHMDIQARRLGGAGDFAGSSASVRQRVLEALADPARRMPPAGFYARLRRIVIGGYYTTEAGFADIGYVGNVALPAFPEPSPEVLAAIERACQQLGLVDAIVRQA
jgi:hypothetical protein